MGVGGQRHAATALPPGKRHGSHFGPHGRSGGVRKILSLPTLDSGTVQPVASRYTDWAIPTQFWNLDPPKLQSRSHNFVQTKRWMNATDSSAVADKSRAT